MPIAMTGVTYDYDATKQQSTIVSTLTNPGSAGLPVTFTVSLATWAEAAYVLAAGWGSTTKMKNGAGGPVVPQDVADYLALAYNVFNNPAQTVPDVSGSAPDISI